MGHHVLPCVAQQPTTLVYQPVALPQLTMTSPAVPVYTVPYQLPLPTLVSPQISVAGPMQLAPEGSVPLFFDGTSPAFTAIPENLVQRNSQNQLIAPEGYSFIPMSLATHFPVCHQPSHPCRCLIVTCQNLLFHQDLPV